MKIEIWKSEAYPVYELVTPCTDKDDFYEVEESLVNEYNELQGEFDVFQRKLEDIYLSKFRSKVV